MRLFWLFPVLTPLMLTACDPRPQSEMNPSDILNSLLDAEGPSIKGVEATLLDSAHQAENRRQYNRALQFYQQLLDKDKQNKTYLLGLADNLRRMGQLDEAAHYYNQILKLEPENLDALEGKGLCLLNRGEVEGASDIFQKVMAKDGKRWRTLNAVGIMFVMKGMPKEAEAYYIEAAKLKPDEPAILNNYGLTLALSQKYDQAVTVLKQASDSLDRNDPEKKRADLNLALVYGLAGDMDRAEEVAGRHLKEAALNNNLGFYAYLADNQELAKAYLNNALSGSPVFYEKAWKNLEIVSGSTVERSQFNAGGGDKNFKRRFKKAPFEIYPKEPEVPEKPIAAPVMPVEGSKDLPAVIPDQPVSPPKVVEEQKGSDLVAPVEPAKKLSLNSDARVEIYPAVPVDPKLEDGIRPVSMSVEMGAPAAMQLMPANVVPQQMMQQPMQQPMPQHPMLQQAMPLQAMEPTPVIAPSPPAKMDIYLPSEMGMKELKKKMQATSAAVRSSEAEAIGPNLPSSLLRKQEHNSEMIVFQAEKPQQPAAAPAQTAVAAPVTPDPAVISNASQAGIAAEAAAAAQPEQPVAQAPETPAQPAAQATTLVPRQEQPQMIIDGESGGIAGTPVPEYQEQPPARRSTLDYFKSVF